ncbi:MAG: hypothetical protein AB1416_13320, partial [Actinomycetota bacterium]
APPAAPVTVELRRSPLGPAPRLRGSRHDAASLLRAALTLTADVADRHGPDGRLILALILEGVLLWQGTAGAGMQSAQQAVAYAVHHAAGRLEERGHPLPAPLARAAAAQRRLAPMSGGA